MKVVWLCHFSNKEIQSILKPHKKVNEYAPWIPMALKVVEGDPRFEIYVISPHEYISGVHQFELRGIHYIFYNSGMPFCGRHWPSFFKWDYISDFKRNKRIVEHYVNLVKPEVIHLQGAENPEYSSTIIPLLDRYPTLLTVQGFISHTRMSTLSSIVKKRIAVEEEIIKKIKVATYNTRKVADDIKSLNPEIKLTWYDYSSFEIKPRSEWNYAKQFDLVFFARICEDKGIGDLLKAVSIIKRSRHNISLCVIGGGDVNRFKNMSADLGISDNVVWSGFLPTQEDVHRLAVTAKVSVLPTYHDIMPGTIMESMFLGIPVVSYDTDSIPEINEGGEAVSLVSKGDIDGLARTIVKLLSNEQLLHEMSFKGRERAYKMFAFTNDQIKDSLMTGYSLSTNVFRSDH